MTLLVVTPVIVPPSPGLVDSWTHRPHLVVVNGAEDVWGPITADRGLDVVVPGGNIGCPASWNLAFRRAADRGMRHVAITSQGIVLAEGGTGELAEAVEEFAGVEFMILAGDYQTFHCVVIAVKVWRTVGPFDEGLPIYSDVDFCYRARLAGINPDLAPRLQVGYDDVLNTAVKAGAVPAALYHEDRRRYVAKWGGEPFRETRREPAEVGAG